MSDASEIDSRSNIMSEVLTESGCVFPVASDNFVWFTYDCNFVAVILLKRSFWYSEWNTALITLLWDSSSVTTKTCTTNTFTLTQNFEIEKSGTTSINFNFVSKCDSP